MLHFVERSVAMHGAHEGEYEPHHHHDPDVGVASAVALAAHSFLDGVGIGLAFQVDNTVGFAVALAVIAHDFADGLNTVTVMRTHGNSRRRQVVMLVVDAVAPVLGALSTLFFSVERPRAGALPGRVRRLPALPRDRRHPPRGARPAPVPADPGQHPRRRRPDVVRGGGDMSRQRSAVQAELARATAFRSAQEIHASLRESGHRIGLTTVYRSLQSLADADGGGRAAHRRR